VVVPILVAVDKVVAGSTVADKVAVVEIAVVVVLAS